MKRLLQLLRLERVEVHILDENRTRIFHFPFVWRKNRKKVCVCVKQKWARDCPVHGWVPR
jgi:hypothetical protein